eukprot:6377076-Amphidinium_carterae.1
MQLAFKPDHDVVSAPLPENYAHIPNSSDRRRSGFVYYVRKFSSDTECALEWVEQMSSWYADECAFYRLPDDVKVLRERWTARDAGVA